MVGNRSGSQEQSKAEKYKKARYAIGNVSMKDLSNKIKEFVGKVLHTDISDGIPCLFVFFDLAMVLRARAVTNPFSDPSNYTFDSEDVVSILFRSSNFSEIFKIS